MQYSLKDLLTRDPSDANLDLTIGETALQVNQYLVFPPEATAISDYIEAELQAQLLHPFHMSTLVDKWTALPKLDSGIIEVSFDWISLFIMCGFIGAMVAYEAFRKMGIIKEGEDNDSAA